VKRALVAGALWCGLAFAGCATTSNDATVCPEHQNLRCVGRVVCDMDRERGCQVCQCEDVTKMGTEPKYEQYQVK
jgi:hypothetical protein